MVMKNIQNVRMFVIVVVWGGGKVRDRDLYKTVLQGLLFHSELVEYWRRSLMVSWVVWFGLMSVWGGIMSSVIGVSVSGMGDSKDYISLSLSCGDKLLVSPWGAVDELAIALVSARMVGAVLLITG